MPISKRKLTKWRKEALRAIAILSGAEPTELEVYANRILLLTQELLDQQLLKEK